jgi:hypothetical protein
MSGAMPILPITPSWNRPGKLYLEYFLGVKAAGALGLQPCHLHVPIVLKFGSLNLLEPSGPVKAYNGIALPFCICSLIYWI